VIGIVQFWSFFWGPIPITRYSEKHHTFRYFYWYNYYRCISPT